MVFSSKSRYKLSTFYHEFKVIMFKNPRKNVDNIRYIFIFLLNIFYNFKSGFAFKIKLSFLLFKTLLFVNITVS